MHARWLSFVIWALMAASLAYWSLTLIARGPAAPGQVLPAVSSGSMGDWTRVFTQEAPSASPVESASARYQLLGVVAPSTGQATGEGVALIAVGGGFARPFRVGQAVDGDIQLVEVSRREVGLGRGTTVSIRLALTPLPGAAPSPMPVQPGPDVAQPGMGILPAGSLPPNQQGIQLNAPPGSVPMNPGMGGMGQGGSPLTGIGGALPQGGPPPQQPDNMVNR
ncbi:hypothetical protein OU995_00570 [Roseateles sp. SL47]|jgi:general secretion pathway protein C|uniref:hypothetical protein n=1 Tax=Roseateles sp. SL47 TaxID=2995138 RepID=UPI00226E7AD4|nr:hypothetical protein [Roseateles sp. SL47]WAC73279.1 hypothetical protein OU995_00570 [Roseateles sp. SL47]